MKELWNPKESIKTNLETMGVAFDANKVVEQQNNKTKICWKNQKWPTWKIREFKINSQ